jgi:lipopolysaccharide transport system permease protein
MRAALTPPTSDRTLLISAGPGSVWQWLPEVFAFRELLYFFVWRDLTLRYRHTAIGLAWALLQPILTTLAFTAIFARTAGMAPSDVPYPVFAMCGLIPWQVFSLGITSASLSLLNNERLVTKVYFPRVLLPLSAVLAVGAEILVSIALLFSLMTVLGVGLTWRAATMPIFLIMALATTVALGLGLSALTVRYRDVRHALPFLVQWSLIATPVAYSSLAVAPPFQSLLLLNPLTGVIEGLRWSLLGIEPFPTRAFATSVLVMASLGVSAALYFMRVERTMADEI